jgi:hypothetical protein
MTIARPAADTASHYRFTRLDSISKVSGSRWISWVLFGLALVRNVVLLLAYPPAHGADSMVYFIYAERFHGFNAPVIADLAPPLYPVFIFLTYKLLGSAYWLTAIQFILSALLPVMGYWICRRYQPLLGLAVGLLILGDVQVAVLYNFTSTEPLYIFLLVCVLWLQTLATDRSASHVYQYAFLTGVLLELLTLARAVGRFLIVPLLLIQVFVTRQYRAAGLMLAGFMLTIGAYALMTLLVFGRVEGIVSTSNINVMTIFQVKPEWVQVENGPGTARYMDITSGCAYPTYFGKVYCLRETLGSWEAAQSLLGSVFSELVRTHTADYASEIWARTNAFLALTGQQLGQDAQTPSEAQCANPDQNVPQTLEDFTRLQWSAILPDFTPATLAGAREVARPIAHAFCPPPWQSSATARRWVDALASRYRSLGRPSPLLWYGGLLMLTLALPFARRYLTLVLAGLAILLNHAVLSSVVLSVEPRYVVVTNPVRIILLSVLAAIVIEAFVKLAGRRQKAPVSETG